MHSHNYTLSSGKYYYGSHDQSLYILYSRRGSVDGGVVLHLGPMLHRTGCLGIPVPALFHNGLAHLATGQTAHLQISTQHTQFDFLYKQLCTMTLQCHIRLRAWRRPCQSTH